MTAFSLLWLVVSHFSFHYIYFQYWKSTDDWILRFLQTYYQKKHFCGN